MLEMYYLTSAPLDVNRWFDLGTETSSISPKVILQLDGRGISTCTEPECGGKAMRIQSNTAVHSLYYSFRTSSTIVIAKKAYVFLVLELRNLSSKQLTQLG